MYEYKAQLVRVIDGDTVRLRVDVGFYMTAEMSFRLAGINAPEMVGADASAGEKAKTALSSMLAGAHELRITTTKADKYGRWLAKIYLPEGPCVNDMLIAGGFAKPY